MINPLAPHVLVPSPGKFLAIRDAVQQETSAGIIIAKGTLNDPRIWTVFATTPPTAPLMHSRILEVGDRVYLPSFAGTTIELPEVLGDILNRVKIFNESDILALVTQ